MRDAFGLPQSVLVLGGGSDIGMATAHALVSRRTDTVILAGRDPTALEPAADRLRAAGAPTAVPVRFDALETGTHEQFTEDIFARFGTIDLVLVAFGVLGDQAAAERDPAAALGVVRTNYVGAVSVLVPVVRRLCAQGQGSVVVLSSVAGERARRANFVYGSAKAGLDAFAQGFGDALVGTGVRVLVVRPGFVHTKMTRGMEPAPLATTPEDVAAAIVGALRTGRETIWVPPALRWVMAVLRHLPRPLFRRLPR